MGLLALVVGVTVVTFWAGFIAPPHGMQNRSQAGFVVALGLSIFVGYVEWRDAESLTRLEALIGLPTDIVDVAFVGGGGDDEESWIVTTTMGEADVLDLSRRRARAQGWTVEMEQAPWVTFARGTERLTLFISVDEIRDETEVLYSYLPAGGGP